ncbi:MAG: DUF6320 domain-containing protein [Candidatus Heimdallarchaeaceae archaeon]
MPYCSRCGVEVDPGIEKCPLCNTPIQKLDDEKVEYIKKYPDEPVIEKRIGKRTDKEKRQLALEILSVSILIPLLIVTFIDLIISRSITWAKFPILVLVFIWLTAAFPLQFPKKPIVLVLGEVGTVLAFLFLIDYFIDWQVEWFLEYALPIIILTILIASLVILASMLVKRKGANVAAFVLFGIGVLVFSLEFTITRTISWSLFVLTPTVVIGGFLLYLHFRFMRKIDLKEKLKQKFQI